MTHIATRKNCEIEHLDDKGEYHCADGPARIMSNGAKWFMVHGRFHRLDGPALEFASGGGRYFINHREMTSEAYAQHPDVLAHSAARQQAERDAKAAQKPDSMAIKTARVISGLPLPVRKR